MRQGAAAEAEGRAWSYDRTCRALDRGEIDRREAAARPRAVRFLVPEGRTAFHDVVRGQIEFDHANLEDFVLLRSDGHPTYHLSVVVDDVEMAISHVVRGDDHISNTPKQVLIYRALGGAGADVRSRAAHPRSGQETVEQTPRRDVGG